MRTSTETANRKTGTETTANPLIVRVREEYQIAQARQAARGVAQTMEFSSVATACIATAVSELASNLFFHANQGGVISLTGIKKEKRVGIEVVSEDDGPGIEDVPLAMRDGYTTRGGLGGGLPSVRRLMDEFEITSKPGVGTRIVARKWMRWR